MVNEQDEVLGTMEKLAAHQQGLLHRAFSILIFNDEGEVLLQKRALCKYHSPGLWTNTCCSHPRPGEPLEDAVHRRLLEEMGFDCELSHAFHFIYHVSFDNGLYEHELDHVFEGVHNEIPPFNTNEVEDAQFFGVNYITDDMRAHPEKYTEWFKIIWKEYVYNDLI